MAEVFQVQGFGLLSNFNGQFGTAAAHDAVDEIAATNANSIELAPRIFTPTKTSNDVVADPAKTESDANIAAAIENAHAHGLSVMLKPMITGLDGTNQGQLAPTDPEAFFASYKAQIVDLAKVAEQAGADSFSIGNEMASLSGPQYRDEWVDIINSVREVYHGTITYSAATDEAIHVSFWDQLDEIGLNAYPPLTEKTDPTVQDMVDAWNTIPTDNYWAAAMDHMSPVDFFHSLATEYGKQVLFTEAGYRSIDGANINPGGGNGSTVDLQEQYDAFNAFFQVWSSEGGSWFKGVQVWNWDANNLFSPTGYSPMGKPAQQLITEWFGGQHQPPALTLTGSPAADLIDVGGGNDTLNGGVGNDTIRGGGGDDHITGGPDVIPRLTDTTITVTGFSSVVDGVGAQMVLLVNGVQVGATVEFRDATSPSEFQTFTFHLHNPDQVTSLDLQFINDIAGAGGDRNLYIKDITINGDHLSPSDATNPSSPGTWNVYQNGTVHYDMTGHQDLFFGSDTDNDIIDGGDGNDVIDGGAGADIIHGGAGIDTITGGPGTTTAQDQLFGDDGNDIVKAGSADTGASLNGGAGNDQLYGGFAADTLHGDDGNDYLSSGGGADVMHGDAGNDSLKGGTAPDQLFGDAGDDTLNGGTGDEHLDGGSGNDKIAGGGGNDILTGGSGDDTFIFAPKFGKDIVNDFTNTGGAHDIIQIDHTVFADFAAVESHMTQVGSEVVITADANNTITLQNVTVSQLTADDFHFV